MIQEPPVHLEPSLRTSIAPIHWGRNLKLPDHLHQFRRLICNTRNRRRAFTTVFACQHLVP